MIEIITFTGVDESTDLEELREVAERYPRAEFGVLFGSQTSPIFPPLETVRALRDLRGVNTALHLCGTHARQAAGEEPREQGLIPLANGFGRVQVNLHGDTDNPARVSVDPARIRKFAEQTGTDSIILQHRGPWEDVPLDHPRVEYLFDLSEGSGEEGFERWPEPPEGKRGRLRRGPRAPQHTPGPGVRGKTPGGQDMVRHGAERPDPGLPVRPRKGLGCLRGSVHSPAGVKQENQKFLQDRKVEAGKSAAHAGRENQGKRKYDMV